MVINLKASSDSLQDLRLDALPATTRRAFLACLKLPLFKKNGWYLAGGTAMTLQVGHRQSLDLDFFTRQKNIKEMEIQRELSMTKKWQMTYQEEGTLYGIFFGAKISFISYPFFRPTKKRLYCGTVSILLPPDIAAMKIIATSCLRLRMQAGSNSISYSPRAVCQRVLRRGIRYSPARIQRAVVQTADSIFLEL